MEHTAASAEPRGEVPPKPTRAAHPPLHEPPRRRSLLNVRMIATAVALVMLCVGGYMLWKFLPSTSGLAAPILAARQEGRPPGTTLARPTSVQPRPPRPGMTVTPTDMEGVSRQMADLNQRVDQLAAQVAEIQRQLDQVARSDEEALDAEITPLAERISRVSRKAEEASALSGRVEKLEQWLNGVGMTVDEIRTAFVALRDRVVPLLPQDQGQGQGGQAAQGGGQQGQQGQGNNDAALINQAIAEGVGFLRQNQFSSALGVGSRVREARPDDARGWYLSALANGYVSGDWRGQTEQFVLRGVELERAGSPPSGQIDSAFAPLPEAVRSWLNTYRSRAAGNGR